MSESEKPLLPKDVDVEAGLPDDTPLRLGGAKGRWANLGCAKKALVLGAVLLTLATTAHVTHTCVKAKAPGGWEATDLDAAYYEPWPEHPHGHGHGHHGEHPRPPPPPPHHGNHPPPPDHEDDNDDAPAADTVEVLNAKWAVPVNTGSIFHNATFPHPRVLRVELKGGDARVVVSRAAEGAVVVEAAFWDAPAVYATMQTGREGVLSVDTLGSSPTIHVVIPEGRGSVRPLTIVSESRVTLHMHATAAGLRFRNLVAHTPEFVYGVDAEAMESFTEPHGHGPHGPRDAHAEDHPHRHANTEDKDDHPHRHHHAGNETEGRHGHHDHHNATHAEGHVIPHDHARTQWHQGPALEAAAFELVTAGNINGTFRVARKISLTTEGNITATIRTVPPKHRPRPDGPEPEELVHEFHADGDHHPHRHAAHAEDHERHESKRGWFSLFSSDTPDEPRPRPGPPGNVPPVHVKAVAGDTAALRIDKPPFVPVHLKADGRDVTVKSRTFHGHFDADAPDIKVIGPARGFKKHGDKIEGWVRPHDGPGGPGGPHGPPGPPPPPGPGFHYKRGETFDAPDHRPEGPRRGRHHAPGFSTISARAKEAIKLIL